MSDDLIRKAHFEQLKAEEKLGDAPIQQEYYAHMNVGELALNWVRCQDDLPPERI